jgi:[acyl-carrier-protein] S-malonyltransferase
MGRELYRGFASARRTFEEVSDALKMDIAKVCFEGPTDALTSTEIAQPAVLCVSVACHRVLESEAAVSADFLCGHSLGEYTALVVSGALSLPEAARLVRRRGELMQSAVPKGGGGMVAVLGLGRSEVESICQKASQGEVLSPANYNAPTQLVISGHRGALERAVDLVEACGGKALKLAVSAPFHCPLMEPAASGLAKELSSLPIRPFHPGIVTNVEAAENTDEKKVRELMIQQVTAPVRWEESVRWMVGKGIGSFLEIGPGRILSGLIEKIDRSVCVRSFERPGDLRNFQ